MTTASENFLFASVGSLSPFFNFFFFAVLSILFNSFFTSFLLFAAFPKNEAFLQVLTWHFHGPQSPTKRRYGHSMSGVAESDTTEPSCTARQKLGKTAPNVFWCCFLYDVRRTCSGWLHSVTAGLFALGVSCCLISQ